VVVVIVVLSLWTEERVIRHRQKTERVMSGEKAAHFAEFAWASPRAIV